MYRRLCSNLLESIGNTPMVRLNNIYHKEGINIYAKLEYFNPGGSIKDRIALYMLEKAERQGKLKKGHTIIENSSGNTAIGLSLVAIQKGYKVKIIMRDSTSREKIEMVEKMGANVLLVDSSLDPSHPDSYNNITPRIARQTKHSYFPDQHNNPDNNEAHYKTTGPEIYEQMEGKIDYLVAGIGTGGTICGAGKFLKEKIPNIKIIAVDIYGSVFYDYYHYNRTITPRRYLLEGLGDEFIIGCPDFKVIDDMLQVHDKEAFSWTRMLARTEGIIAGGSSGAALSGAVKTAERVDGKANIVTIFADSGYRYLRTIYNDQWLKVNNLL